VSGVGPVRCYSDVVEYRQGGLREPIRRLAHER
jgi:hypothetical protein